MKKILFITLIVVGACRNDIKIGQIKEEGVAQQRERGILSPSVFPQSLYLKTISHDMILNTNLFDQYSLKKGESAKSNPSSKVSNFSYSGDFIDYLRKSDHEDPTTYGAQEMLNFELSFDCSRCLDATLVRFELNSKELPKADKLAEFLDGSNSAHRKITKNRQGRFHINTEIQLQRNGLIGIYLVLRDEEKKVFIYEIAGLKADGLPPVFIRFEDFPFVGDEDYEGLVCLTSMQFEGNQYSGYNVPIKGHIYGDIAELKINGKSIIFKQGEFYQRVHMNLEIGYNRIPILLRDKHGNTTESYIEITLERINDEPSINIYLDM